MNQTIRIGTRGSKLALWQANYVADLIKPSGCRTEIIPIDTKGDKILDVTIDIAVHSAKDLSSQLADELELIAFTERELVNDVVLSFDKKFNLKQENIRIGTSSTRRVSFLKHFYPQAKAVPIRGNLQTR